ncbi:GntR family transcriptional regulator [Cupriavidus sp. CP313]
MPTVTADGESGLSADAITNTLRNLIFSGSLGIGIQLKQQALAKRFGVSRIPVREALKRLEAEGLVEHTPHQGSIVAPRSIPEVIEALDIRIALETRALSLAIPNISVRDYEEASEIIDKYDGSGSPAEWAELNLQFHMALYRPCQRPRLLRMIEETERGIGLHLRAIQSLRLGRESSQEEHRLILDACMTRDVSKAVELLARHIEHTQLLLRESYVPKNLAYA